MTITRTILVPLIASLVLASPLVAQDSNEEKLGEVSFQTSCAPEVRDRFNRAMALLHSFWYEAAEAAFVEIAEQDPNCAMAHWGVAMTAVHPLWPDTPRYDKGKRASAKAAAIGGGTPVESGYIDAVSKFFVGVEPPDYPARKKAFELAMATMHEQFPQDAEVTIFYALALTATASPRDKTFANQKRAAAMLDALAPSFPQHPGILHYTIHAYDSPEMAEQALDVARRYSEVASSVPHGLHMSSHIFTRLGLWKESVATNSSASHAGHSFASELGLPGAWDEELHAMEYWMYGLLQLADDDAAEKVLTELRAHPTGSPMSLKSAHPFAGVPARYYLERRQWKAAASFDPFPADLPWEQFPYAHALNVFTRAMASARTAALDDARSHLERLESLRDQTQNPYWSRQIEVLRLEVAGWVAHEEGDADTALRLMRSAAELEESMEKDPVTPGPVLPAREQLGELLIAMDRPGEALAAFEAALAVAPNRFNGLYGAGVAARDMGNTAKARGYFAALVTMCDEATGNRPELDTARRFLD